LHFKAGRDTNVWLEHAVFRSTMSMVLNWVRFVDGVHVIAGVTSCCRTSSGVDGANAC
jgi:hypothetical protein